MQQKRYLRLTRNSFHVFFTANGIVGYGEFISSSFYVRFKWTCGLAGLELLNTDEQMKYPKC